MNRATNTFIWLSAMCVARFADFATTAHFTPGLSEEANPLVSYFGGHWPVLITVNIAVCLGIALLAMVHCKAAPRTDVLDKCESTWDFASCILYGQRMNRREFIIKRVTVLFPPKGYRLSHASLYGFILPPTITCVSFFAVFAWFATRDWKLEWFMDLHSQLGIFLLLIAVIICAVPLEILYYRQEYKRALKQNHQGVNKPE